MQHVLRFKEPAPLPFCTVLYFVEQAPGTPVLVSRGADLAECHGPVAHVPQDPRDLQRIGFRLGLKNLQRPLERADAAPFRQFLDAEAVTDLAQRLRHQRTVVALLIANDGHRAAVIVALPIEPKSVPQPHGVLVQRGQNLQRILSVQSLHDPQTGKPLRVGLLEHLHAGH